MGLGLKVINLYGTFLRMMYRFTYVYTVEEVDFYVAADARTRAFFDEHHALAMAVGSEVYARSRRALTADVIAHEMKHVEQAKEHGVLFPLKYWAASSRGYQKNKFEKQARRAERRRGYRKTIVPRWRAGAVALERPHMRDHHPGASPAASFLRILAAVLVGLVLGYLAAR